MQVNRTEHKFFINQQEKLLAAEKLAQIMPLDPHCSGGRSYEIRSLYFDTVTDRCCTEKEDGLLVHEKIRIRIYGTDDSVIKLESKRKVGSAQTKQTMLITRPVMEALCAGNYQVLLGLSDPLAGYFYQKLSRGMLPRTIIQYQRLSFNLDTNNTRITFDYDIRATEACTDLFQQPLMAHPIFPSNQVILEVKFNNFLLGYIKNALRCLHVSPSSYSKYLNGRTFRRQMI